jgi:hypothetical protein
MGASHAQDSGRRMGDAYELQVAEQPSGRWRYQLVAVGAPDSLAWESDGKSYLTRADAERAGRLALAAKLFQGREQP